MIVVNTKSKKAVYCNKAKAAEIVGVCTKTLWAWEQSNTYEKFNHFEVYFDSTIIPNEPRGVSFT